MSVHTAAMTGEYHAFSTDVSPSSRFSVQEIEVRNNFTSYMSEIVSKNGEGGSKKDKSFEAMQKRADKAIEGAKRYRTQLNERAVEEAEIQLQLNELGI